MAVTEEALAPPAERELRDGSGDADVHPDVAGVHRVPEVTSVSTVRREDTGHVPEGAIVGHGDGLVDRRRVDQTQHGTEDLGRRQDAMRRRLVDDRRKHPIAVLVALHRLAAAVACIVTRILSGNRDWTAIGFGCGSLGFLFFQLHRREARR